MKWISSEVDVRKPEENHIILWRFLGIIPPKTTNFKRHLYIFCSLMLHTVCTFYFNAALIIYTIKTETFKDFCESAFFAIPVTGITLRFVNTLRFLPKINDFSVISERLHTRAENDEEIEILKKEIRHGHQMLIRFLKLFTVTTLFELVLSLVLSVLYEPVLLAYAWYPLDWKHNRYAFVFCTSHQIIAGMIVLLEAAVSETYIISYIQYIIGHIKAFIIRIRKFNMHAKKRSSDENIREITEFIKDHQHILRYVQKRDF